MSVWVCVCVLCRLNVYVCLCMCACNVCVLECGSMDDCVWMTVVCVSKRVSVCVCVYRCLFFTLCSLVQQTHSFVIYLCKHKVCTVQMYTAMQLGLQQDSRRVCAASTGGTRQLKPIRPITGENDFLCCVSVAEGFVIGG